MKPSTKRIMTLVLSIALIVMALFLYVQYVKPAYDEVQGLRATKASQAQYYTDQSQAVASINDLLARQQNKKTLRDDISLRLPLKESVADIISQLQAISQETGILIQSVGLEYLPVTKNQSASFVKGLGTLRLNVRLFGAYEPFKQFLDGLETNIRIMDVASLKASQAGKAGQDVQTYNLTVDTYYQIK